MAQNINDALQALGAGGGQDEIYRALLHAAQGRNHANLRLGQMQLVPSIRPNLAFLPEDIVFPANMAELFSLTGGQLNELVAAYELPIAGTLMQRRLRLLRFLIGSGEQVEGQDGN